MDLPDNQLDYLISYTLDSESVVTTKQKQATWTALKAKAAQQVIMAPYAEAPRPRPQPAVEVSVWERISTWVFTALTDESRYERAALIHQNLYSSSLGSYLIGVDHIARFSA